MSRARGLALALSLCACPGAPSPARRPLVIAAAADLARAFAEVGDAWARAGHARPTMTFGSSGLLAAQIAQGAPFDAFASADVAYVRAAVQSGRCDGATETLYARGALALVTRAGLVAPRALADLADPRFMRVAIANPEHAPYGRAARQALESAGAWHAVEPRLVFGENVRQALQYVQSGNADAALVARSLAVAGGLPYAPVDEALHRPLAQALVACGRGAAADEARAFVRFVASPEGQAVLRRHGFSPP
jgi:molybdate transport system substrate-binding protein